MSLNLTLRFTWFDFKMTPKFSIEWNGTASCKNKESFLLQSHLYILCLVYDTLIVLHYTIIAACKFPQVIYNSNLRNQDRILP